MKERLYEVGLALCGCGGALFSAAEAGKVLAALKGAGVAVKQVLLSQSLCTAAGMEEAVSHLKDQGPAKLLFAGCSPSRRPGLLANMAARTGLSPGAAYRVALRPGAGALMHAAAILRGLKALAARPAFQTRLIPLEQRVLVVGSGPAGLQSARDLRTLGYETVLVDQGVETASGSEGLPGGLILYNGSRLAALNGQLGSFKALLETPCGNRTVSCGAVVITCGAGGVGRFELVERLLGSGSLTDGAGRPTGCTELYGLPIVPLAELAAFVGGLPRGKETLTVGLLLDLVLDEPVSSMEEALRLGRELQLRGPQRIERQVYLFCREVKVSSLPLQGLYDEAREAGVVFVQVEGRIGLEAEGRGVAVSCRDSVLSAELRVLCDCLGVSPLGLSLAADPVLAAGTGVAVDGLGQLQENNIHLFPELTNRPGVFVAGPGRGQYALPQALREARVAALAVHRLLAQKHLEVELANAQVDADKCALCLACVRSCPFKAMGVNREKAAAESYPEACRRCGLCAGECPARAIELPLHTDAALLALVD